MPDRAARCAALLAASFPDGGHWSEAEIAAILQREGGYLFENEGGFLIVSAVLDEAEIWTIAVAPEMRRQGHARALIEQAIDKLELNGCRQIYLEVADDNDGAVQLYLGLGFAETGRRKGYYRSEDGSKSDAILMTLTLGD